MCLLIIFVSFNYVIIMKYKDFSRVPSWKRDLVRKIGLFGLSDLRRLSPISDP